MVVETADDVFLGTVELANDLVIVRSGYVGRPVTLPADQVVRITPATEHPDVETDAPAPSSPAAHEQGSSIGPVLGS